MGKKCLFFILMLFAIGGFVWAIQSYFELPTVKFSVSQQKVVAVENFEGEALPLYPLPEKYMNIYVK
ncbi:MAG: hypothetical protein NT078_01320 [Candidatus Azambacteria bacterium]|nr:hypothetical protein [Candidatus Azambacteria bacterium]